MVKRINGELLKQAGIQQSLFTAEKKYNGWRDKAFDFLIGFAEKNNFFLTEDVRRASAGIIPEPPSLRAWGGVVVRARKAKIVEFAYTATVKNPNAHKCFASVWKSKILKN